MTYTITEYTYNKAKALGVKVKPSKNKRYKIDIYDLDNDYITSVGSSGYKDFPTFMIEKGKEYAENKKKLYRLRHNKYRNIEYSRSWYADQLLW